MADNPHTGRSAQDRPGARRPSLLRELWTIVHVGALRGWPGHSCPDCGVRPRKKHRAGCTTGAWDGGTWA